MNPESAAKPVVSRSVVRHFWNGKGYPSRVAAYRAKAKAMLMEMVLGPWEEVRLEHGSYHRLANGLPPRPEGEPDWWHPSDRERREWTDARFAIFFPHDRETGCECTPKGCIPTRFRCDLNLELSSCRWAQEQWIRAKVAELMQAEGART